jgi:DNA repair protein RadC
MNTDKKPRGEVHSPQPIVSAKYAVPYLTYIRGRTQEHIVCLALNSRMCLIAKKTIFIGSLNSSIIHPREIFKYAMSKSAASIIIAHNHPTGNSVPSDADIEVTHQIVAAGKIIGIDVLDHIIVGTNEHFSFADKGMFLSYKVSKKLNTIVR